jgi:hypothetical protein
MKKVSVILSVVAVTMALLLVSCGGGGGKSPAEIEQGLWDLIKQGKYEKAVDYWADNSDCTDKAQKETLKGLALMSTEKMKQSIEEKGLKDVKISQTISEDGLTANVDVVLTYGDGSTEDQTKKYKKVDGQWKIDSAK